LASYRKAVSLADVNNMAVRITDGEILFLGCVCSIQIAFNILNEELFKLYTLSHYDSTNFLNTQTWITCQRKWANS